MPASRGLLVVGARQMRRHDSQSDNGQKGRVKENLTGCASVK
jgi:hypothetical protein